MIRGETLRLRIRAERDESGSSRAVDIMSKTQLDVVAQVLRAVSNHERDEKQYRIEIGPELYGNPRGRSHANVQRGTKTLEGALEKTSSFRFRSDLRQKKGHMVGIEKVFHTIWAPEDHPLLVDIDGEMPGGRRPETWTSRGENGNTSGDTAAEAKPGFRRVDEIAQHYLRELGYIRDRRRGPIRSHFSGRRGWRDRWNTEHDPAGDALYARAEAALREFTESGGLYTGACYGYYEQRPCLIEQVGLESIAWCTRDDCAGCRRNQVYEHLFAGSEVWTTRRGDPKPFETMQRRDEILVLRTKPVGRVTVRVSHPAGDQADAAESLRMWEDRVDAEDRARLGIWIAPSGRSWRGPGERTAVLWQPVDLPGPAGWTRAERSRSAGCPARGGMNP